MSSAVAAPVWEQRAMAYKDVRRAAESIDSLHGQGWTVVAMASHALSGVLVVFTRRKS